MIVLPSAKMDFRMRGLWRDDRGVAAIEFALIFPLMLVMFFGLEEFSKGLAVSRQVTLVARTLSDLTSQSVSVSDADLSSFAEVAKAIMTPGDPSILKSSITELYVDPKTLVARVQWSRALSIDATGKVTVGPSARGSSSTVGIPPQLMVGGTYLIWSEVSYTYKPTIGFVMGKSGIDFTDFSFTRPRLTACVFYPAGVQKDCPVV